MILAPNDYEKYIPKEFSDEELDNLHVDHGHRDKCKNYIAEYRQCWLTVRQHHMGWRSVKSKLKSNCMYYYDHWAHCTQVEGTKNGLATYLGF